MATTSRSLSWIDRARFGSLLDVARGGDTPLPPAVARAPGKVQEAPATRRTLRPVMTGAAAAVPAFLPPESQLDTRLAAFLSWVVERTGCSAVFVADEGGLPVAESAGTDPARVAAVSAVLAMLAQFRQAVGRSTGGWVSVHFDDQVMHFVEVQSDWGRFGAGLLTPDSLSSRDLLDVREALLRAFVPVGQATGSVR